MISNLTYELSVLAKSIHHKNLSAAAVHVGLSQPQLSRLIAKIEDELNVVLLDRGSKKKSAWTQMAHDLSMTYNKGIGKLEHDILTLAKDAEISEIRIATLEGLSSIAVNFAKKCFEQLKLKFIYLDVLDFKDLDSQFLDNELDLIFTVRAPSKQKYTHMLEVGYQQMERVSSNPTIVVASPFEFNAHDKKILHPNAKAIISNSLSLRSKWLHTIGGTGTLPVDAKAGKGKGQYTIYLIGKENINRSLWEKICGLIESQPTL